MRPKPLLTYFILCAIPLLLFAGLNYWNGVSTVDSTLSTIAQNDLNSFTGAIDEVLKEREQEILGFATKGVVANVIEQKERNGFDLKTAGDFSRYFQSLALFTNDRQPLCSQKGHEEWTFANLDSANLPQPDQRVWTSPGNAIFEAPGSEPGTIIYSAPVNDGKTGTNLGAVAGVLDLRRVFATAARGLKSRSSKVFVTDSTGKTIYGDALPDSTYQTAYAPIPQLAVTAAVARQRSDFTSVAHRWGIAGLVIALLTAAAAAWLLERHVNKRSRGMARVSEDLSAIAKGELDRRIILQSSDDARVIADNINVVTEQLREKIRREQESRQLESFVRFSAMLTHDLKNAIEGLSLTVSNMEHHFDNPHFRADAM
jgi:hypothetical protein